MIPIGIMQGRLSPPTAGRIQAFPSDSWREEFPRARAAGLACIEWIYETGSDGANPLGSDAGVAEIRQLMTDTGVSVWSACADYYMSELLVTPDGSPSDAAVVHLSWLIGRCALLRLRYIVLPFVDASALRTPKQVNGVVTALRRVLPDAERAGIELHLETDLPPDRVAQILLHLAHPLVRANYDTGNSASLGYRPEDELSVLGRWLGSVHVKDRVRGGATVRLGTGSTDFATCFRMFRRACFGGPFILQTAREPELTETELAIRNRRFIAHYLSA